MRARSARSPRGKSFMNASASNEAGGPDGILHMSPSDPRARPVLAAIAEEYRHRYAEYVGTGALEDEQERYPSHLFEPPQGIFLLLVRGEQPIGGGAFTRLDERTAEIKRVWTDDRYRRQGVARRVIEALEREARSAGYARLYLTTGFLQPEAVGLYRALGYRPLFDVNGDWRAIGALPFELDLLDRGPAP